MAHEPADLMRPPPDGVEVTAVPHPFSTKHIQFLTDSHATLAELVAEAGVPPGYDARVFLERRGVLYGPIPREQWPRIRPKKGCRVTIRALPGTGGGGGGDSNKTLRMILIAVILIVAIVVTVATSGLGGGIFAAVIPLVASLAIFAVNALLPPPPPKLGSLAALAGNPTSSTAAASATYSITGSQNKANPYGVIPKVFGTMRIFPPSEEGEP